MNENAQETICPNCGRAEPREGVRLCPNCGATLSATSSSAQQRTVAQRQLDPPPLVVGQAPEEPPRQPWAVGPGSSAAQQSLYRAATGDTSNNKKWITGCVVVVAIIGLLLMLGLLALCGIIPSP